MQNNSLPPGFNGDYAFDIKDIFSRAMKLSGKNNWTLAQALLCILAITFAVYFIFIDAYGINDLNSLLTQETPMSVEQQVAIEFALTSILAPLWTGVAMLAIRTNRNEDVSFTDIFSFYRLFIGVVLASIIVSMVFTLGLSLYVIPGFYIFTATTFTLPLIADKGLAPISAILMSVKMTNVYLTKMLMVYAVFTLLLLLVLLSFGVAYIWIGPFYFNVKAIIYDDLFSIPEQNEVAEAQTQCDSADDGVFNA